MDSRSHGVAYFPSEVCDDENDNENMEVEELSSSVKTGNVIKSLSNDMSKLWELGTSHLWSCGPSPPPRSRSFASSDEGSDLMTPTSSSKGNRKRRSKVARPRSFRKWRQSDEDGFEFPNSLPTRPQWDDKSDSSVEHDRRRMMMTSRGFNKEEEEEEVKNVIVAKSKNTFQSKADETDSDIDMVYVNSGSNSSSGRSRSRCSSSGSISADL